MTVPVVEIGVVRMPMHHGRVRVPVRVRLPLRRARFVRVPVVGVMPMAVLVRHLLVGVQVIVPLRQVEPQAERHQSAGEDEARRAKQPGD